jgi:hypothetical protein
MVAVACLAALSSRLSAQAVEIVPFGGYRFGGDFFELITGQPVDLDGATALGGVVDLPIANGLQFEALFTHQHADFIVPPSSFRPETSWQISVDHWQAGALQEFSGGPVRPFMTGLLGVTRYASEADSEVRFTLGGGGGAKLFPSSRLGVRLDGRLFVTFVDAGGSIIACSPGFCFLAVRAHVVWQAEFSAGLVFRFP